MLDAFAFDCGYNGCSLPDVLSRCVLFASFFVFFVLLFYFKKVLKFPLAVMSAGLIVLLLTLLPQSLTRLTKLTNRFISYSPLSVSDKRVMMFGDSFFFSAYVTKLLPGPRSARLITDINLHEGDGWGVHDRLTYYLYPIDIRVENGQCQDNTLIFFHKANAIKLLPPGYKVIFRPDEANIVAVREGAS
ncbi:MAG: hypothetical protein HQL22_03065 [Candidatus Omnitrophica bacterium]|nr:hypothetical protein [Candidatus Omnitrophota bacterium]